MTKKNCQLLILGKVFFYYSDASRCVFLYHKRTKMRRPTQHCNVISHRVICVGWHEPSPITSFCDSLKNKRKNIVTSESCNYPVSQIGTNILKISATFFFRVKKNTWCHAAEYKNIQFTFTGTTFILKVC